MQVSCTDSDVHSCFELRSVLSQSSWIRHYKSVVVVIIIIIIIIFALRVPLIFGLLK